MFSTASSSTSSPSTTPPGAPHKTYQPPSYDGLDAVATTLFSDGDKLLPPSPPPSPPTSPRAMNPPPLGPKDRDYQSHESSPLGSPVCPGAPRASRFSGMSFGEALAAHMDGSDVARELF
jgi:hypothetical protein